MPVIKVVSIYAESHLPKRGWFQACIMCEVITSSTEFVETKVNNSGLVFDIHAYICPHCKKKLKLDDFKDKYKIICKDMIKQIVSPFSTDL